MRSYEYFKTLSFEATGSTMYPRPVPPANSAIHPPMQFILTHPICPIPFGTPVSTPVSTFKTILKPPSKRLSLLPRSFIETAPHAGQRATPVVTTGHVSVLGPSGSPPTTPRERHRIPSRWTSPAACVESWARRRSPGRPGLKTGSVEWGCLKEM